MTKKKKKKEFYPQKRFVWFGDTVIAQAAFELLGSGSWVAGRLVCAPVPISPQRAQTKDPDLRHAMSRPGTYLKAWTMTVPKRMKRAEKIRDSRGIISRLERSTQLHQLVLCWSLSSAEERQHLPSKDASAPENTAAQWGLFWWG